MIEPREYQPVQVTHYRYAAAGDGTFDILRIDRWLASNGDVIRRSEAIVLSGVPTQRAARAATRAQRMTDFVPVAERRDAGALTGSQMSGFESRRGHHHHTTAKGGAL